MIGAGLGNIDEALAHHLALEKQRVTLVTNVVAGLPAANAGVQRFDVIVGVNGSDSASPKTLRGLLANAAPGTKFALKVRRGAKTKTVELEAVAFDAEKLAVVAVEGMDLGAFVDGDALPDGFTTVDVRSQEQGDVMIFVGPDGEMRELRMPSIPSLPPMPGVQGRTGASAFDTAELERFVQEVIRQMESRFQRGSDRSQPEVDDAGRAEQEMRAAEQRRAEDARRERESDRMRRLEEQMERLMRELEREREERGRAKPGSDA
ncbi:MAG: PDZ domain-containing protein [bacterium]